MGKPFFRSGLTARMPPPGPTAGTGSSQSLPVKKFVPSEIMVLAYGTSANTALVRGRKTDSHIKKAILAVFAVALFALLCGPRLQEGSLNISMMEKSIGHGTSSPAEKNPESSNENARHLKAMFDNFRSQIESEIKSFDVKFKNELGKQIRSPHSDRKHPGRISFWSGQVRQKRSPSNEYMETDRQEDMSQLTEAIQQHKALLSCIAKHGSTAESPRQRRAAQHRCFARARSGAAAAAPALLSVLASNHSNWTKHVWRPRDYHVIGYVAPEHNFSHYVRENIIRHSAPVRANPWDDRRPADPSVLPLSRAGVRVSADPFAAEPPHAWGGDGRDHHNASAAPPPPFPYARAQHPAWAHDNHALKSQARPCAPASPSRPCHGTLSRPCNVALSRRCNGTLSRPGHVGSIRPCHVALSSRCNGTLSRPGHVGSIHPATSVSRRPATSVSRHPVTSLSRHPVTPLSRHPVTALSGR